MYQNIQRLCKEHNTTITALENALNFPRGSIYKWDAHRPSIDKVKAVAEFFGVQIEEVLA